MSEIRANASPQKWVADWAVRLDGLATDLMVHGSAPALKETLTSLKEEARVQGYLATCDIANRLEVSLDDPGAVAALLSGGINELRCSLDQPAEVAPSAVLSEDEDLVRDFLVEAREHLSQIEGQMLILEREPGSMEILHAVFRAFHTIKGLAGFLDFRDVQAIAHEVETLLDLARNEKLVIRSSIVDIVLESGDFLLHELTAIEESLDGSTPRTYQDPGPLALRIQRLGAECGVVKDELGSAPDDGRKVSTELESEAFGSSPDLQDTAVLAGCPADPGSWELPADAVSTSVTFESLKGLPAMPDRLAEAQMAEPVGVQMEPGSGKKTASPPKGGKDVAGRDAPARPSEAGSVRVETSKLDHLMNMVGEIVIAQSLIRHNPMLTATTDSRLLGDLSQLARVTAEVQRATMSMRMIPVGQLFQRIERVIRDLSRKAGKQVVLETSGTETEIDKTVAEELSDPLLHMIRNSVDHGVEMPDERIAAGKLPLARIRLSAHHQGSQIVIQIEDDGRGLNVSRIRRKAEERGLVSPSAVLADEEVYQLIFEPGFSTAEQITDISGRGVGMDVVRRNVEKLQGRIETHSVAGHGTTFQLKLPLTLAIIDGLVVDVDGERYIIALSAVREIFRPKQNAIFSIEGRHEVVLVRDQLMPVICLQEKLGLAPRSKALADSLLVVIESEGKRFCLLVDDLVGKQEVVIKSLGEMFSDVAGFSGCAVLGDGRVGLILDVDGVCRGKRV
jgi:two-component system chemotaxis sensor kinase CheA